MLVDDHLVVREGVKRMIQSAAHDIEIVAEAADSAQAIDLARSAKPEVVLLDVSLPGAGGLDVLQEIKRTQPHVAVVLLTVHPEDQFAVRALRSGADGYLTKDVAPEELVTALRKVHGGGKYVSQSLAERLAESLGAGTAGGALHERLSNRELQVLRLLATGLSVSEIAKELNLSVKTISTYRSRILEKTGMKTTGELMRYAIEEGLAD